jgi:hypothetical protein
MLLKDETELFSFFNAFTSAAIPLRSRSSGICAIKSSFFAMYDCRESNGASGGCKGGNWKRVSLAQLTFAHVAWINETTRIPQCGTVRAPGAIGATRP